MTSDSTTSPALCDHDPKRSIRRVGAVAGVAVLMLAACTSDPGARRVARDIIEAEAEANPELDEACMLEALEQFDDSDLEDITDRIGGPNEGSQAEGQAALDEFEAALANCN